VDLFLQGTYSVNVFFSDRGKAELQIVVVDASSLERTSLEIVVVNKELSGGWIRPKLTECQTHLDGIPDGPAVFIPPLNRHSFYLTLMGVLPSTSITCVGKRFSF